MWTFWCRILAFVETIHSQYFINITTIPMPPYTSLGLTLVILIFLILIARHLSSPPFTLHLPHVTQLFLHHNPQIKLYLSINPDSYFYYKQLLQLSLQSSP